MEHKRKLLFLSIRLLVLLLIVHICSCTSTNVSGTTLTPKHGPDSTLRSTTAPTTKANGEVRKHDQKTAEKNHLAIGGDLGKTTTTVASQSVAHDSSKEDETMTEVHDPDKEYQDEHGHEHHKPTRYQIASFEWHEVQLPYTVAIWILLASIAKIGFRMFPRFSDIFPDSSLLIMVGLFVGILLSSLNIESNKFSLNSQTFFLYLLPPIVFDAGYFMPNRAFFDNLGSILTFAVIGTVWNMATIGISLWIASLSGIFSAPTPLLHILLFSSLISAVDPVAVIVVFEEIHVNEVLFITVFGESLLNDAVTVVLYEIFKSFSEIGSENLLPVDYAAGGLSFFTVALGGVLIGLIWAFIVSFTTKYTKQVKVLNPVFVFVMPYCAYLTAEMFGLSAIMAIVFCGIAMKQYIKLNISTKAITSIKYFTKMLSGMSETIIFMFLGLSTIRKHHWDFPFIALTVTFCLVYRALGVVIQSYFLNKYRLIPYSKVDQFVIAYGGLRGAIAFGLVVALPNSIPGKDLFITATIVVIYVTVFLQGMTMKPLVNWLKIKLDDHRTKTMTEHMFQKQIDFVMVGLEDICGFRGHHWLRNGFQQFNSRWLMPLLVRKGSVKRQGSKLLREFTRLQMRDAVDIARGKIPSPSGTLKPGPGMPKTDDIDDPSSSNVYSNPIFADLGEKTPDEHLDIHQILPKKNYFSLCSKDALPSSAAHLEDLDEKVRELNKIGLSNVYLNTLRKRSSSVPLHNVVDSDRIGTDRIRRALRKARKEPSFVLGEEDENDDDILSHSQPAATVSLPMPIRHPRRMKIPEIKIDLANPSE